MKRKKSSPYKHIVRKKQKRKDGKKVYYYVNKTDGGITNKENYERNETLKQKIKSVYGASWKEVFFEGVKEVKHEEKRYKQNQKKQRKLNIEDSLNADGYPIEFAEFINTSFYPSFVEKVLDNENILLKFRERYYILGGMDLLDFKFFCEELLEYFFDKVRELYKKKKKTSSPMLLFPWVAFSGGSLPVVEGSILDEISTNEDFSINYGKTKAQKGKSIQSKVSWLFNTYLSGLKEVNLYDYISKLLKQKADEKRKK